MEATSTTLKKCPFCGEQIQAEAIKCRFCGEFLQTTDIAANIANAPQGATTPGDARNPLEVDRELYFEGSPSLLALTGKFIVAFVLLGVAGFIAYYFPQYHGPWIGLGLAALVIVWVMIRIVVFKSTRYRVTSDRIEFEEGVLSKDVDNLDLYRIVDLHLRQSLLDRIFGIGTIDLVTTDTNQSNCELYKIKDCRRVYDILKKANLTADRRRGVLHVD